MLNSFLVAILAEVMEYLPPPSLHVEVVDSSTVVLNWSFNDSENCADHFEIFTFINGEQQSETILTTNTIYTVTSIDTSAIYAFRISSVNTVRNVTGLMSDPAIIYLDGN